VHARKLTQFVIGLVVCGSAAAAAFWYVGSRVPPVPHRTLRIGFELNPPVQIRTADGYTGLAVDVVNEAAKRAGLHLQWVEVNTSSEQALRNGLVDLWPLMADLPERHKYIHITRPWLHSDYVLIAREGSVSPDRTFSGRIAVFKLPLLLRLVRRKFSSAQLYPVEDRKAVIREVCLGSAPVGFLEGSAALTSLQEKPPECGSEVLRVQTLPELTTQAGLASTFEAAGAADLLRSEISSLFRDGTLATKIAKYSFYSLDDTWATYDMLQAVEHARWTAWVLSGMALALTLALWQAHAMRQRRQVAAALGESERRFREMADTAPVMICAFGPDLGATFFNKVWLAFTGRSLQQELGTGWQECVHPEDLDAFRASQTSAFNTRQDCRLEYRLRRADGEYRWLLCNAVPRFTPEGVFLGYISSCIDMTDVRRAQEEALASQKLESLGVLAGGIAHDFNNLLGSIVANAELVLTELPCGSTARGGVESIKAVADRAAGIVRELMAYGSQESPAVEAIDLAVLVGEMLELLKVSISKHASLRVDLPPDLPSVRANSAQIRQVVMNLITNASEALGPGGGVIGVTAARVQRHEVPDNVAAALPPGDYVLMEVSDTGCGMTEEVQTRMFEPFFTTKFAGRGLGLAAVQGIVRAHGGAIKVNSVPGEGTRFQVLLPCSGQPARCGCGANGKTSSEIGRATGTVLIVEDEQVLRDAVSKMLRKREFTVIEAGDGSTAVELFRGSKDDIDVILLDMTIPGRPSHDVIAEVQQIRPGIKVILTTAYSRETAAHSFESPHVRGFIRKPYQVGELVHLIRDVMSAKG
jgi:PAS domain S-box-containing protein